MRFAAWVFGIASIWAGILDLVFGEFEAAHQPIQAWGDHIPGVAMLARIAALWLILGGLAVLIRPAARFGAVALAILYGIFCLFPLPRVITAPHYMGHHANIYIGVFVSVGQQIIVFVGAVFLCMQFSAWGEAFLRWTWAGRWLFGLCCIDFGLAHLVFLKFTAGFIPAQIPFHEFWAVFTGLAFILAGLAIVSGILNVVAARLTTIMLFLFSVLVLTPHIFGKPHDHVTWGSDAYNLTAVGAAWIFSLWLEEHGSTKTKSQMRAAAETASA